MYVRRVWVAPDAVDRGARLLDVVRACAQTASLVHTRYSLRYFFTESFLAEKSRVNKRFMHWCGQPTGYVQSAPVHPPRQKQRPYEQTPREGPPQSVQ